MVLNEYDQVPFRPGNILNINVPPGKQEIKGIRITKLGERAYSTDYEKRLDPLGRPYYWLVGKELTVTNRDDADIVAIRDGYISITPLRLELTDETWYNQLKQITWNFEGKSKGN
jgi:5'-nucleotidase